MSDPGGANRRGRRGGRRGRRVVDDMRTARALMSLRSVERVVHRRGGVVPTLASDEDSESTGAAAVTPPGGGGAYGRDAYGDDAIEPTMARDAIELVERGCVRV